MPLSKRADARWEGRLKNWASFMVDRGGGGAKISSAYSLQGKGAPGDDDGIPGLWGDADDTNKLIMKLDLRTQRVLIAKYVSPLEDEEAANHFGIDLSTYQNLIRYAKEALERMHNDRFHGKPIKSARLIESKA